MRPYPLSSIPHPPLSRCMFVAGFAMRMPLDPTSPPPTYPCRPPGRRKVEIDEALLQASQPGADREASGQDWDAAAAGGAAGGSSEAGGSTKGPGSWASGGQEAAG